MQETSELRKTDVVEAIARTQRFFIDHQQADGHWVAELEGDVLLESEMILLLAFLKEEDSDLAKKCAAYLVKKQVSDGGWEMYPGAGSDVTNSVKAYFALKLTGYDVNSEVMRNARERIIQLGGADKVNSFTRFYLALLGQIPYRQTPAVPPQMMLLPRWFPVTIYSMSSWSRTIFVPLSIVSAMQPVRQLSPEQGIRELFIKSPETWGPLTAPGHNPSNNLFSWNRFFRWVDAGMWFCRRHGFTPFRRKGIKKALDWTLEHFKRSDGPGAIYPPIIWALVAFKSLGYADTSPEVSTCRQLLDDLVLTDEQEGTCRLQPCKSPVWDTSLTLKALLLSGLPEESPTIQKGIDWLISKQILNPGDWNQRVALMKNRGSGKTAGNFCGYSFLPKVNIRPGGWAFEYNNEFYPDNDDTAMALMVIGGRFDSGGSFGHAISGQKETTLPLRGTAEKWLKQLLPGPSQRVGMPESQQKTIKTQRVIQRGLRWLFAMQSRDGGWGAFDKDNIQQILCKVPFADHNAMIDPSSPDLTGRVMESLGRLGFTLQSGHPAIQQSVDFMRKQQLPNGSWFGRWGVHYIYGTWQALTGLTAVGVAKDSEMVQAGVNWLLTHQDRSGGWGESPNAYRDLQLAGQGTPTASQTAWAVMGLIAAGLVDHPATYRGIQFLLRNQNPDGTWTEKEFTGTGFPQVFYLRYHYYPVYFPLMALSLFLGQSDRLTRDSCLQNEPGDVSRVGAGETERRSGNAPVSGNDKIVAANVNPINKESGDKDECRLEKRYGGLRIFWGDSSFVSLRDRPVLREQYRGLRKQHDDKFYGAKQHISFLKIFRELDSEEDIIRGIDFEKCSSRFQKQNRVCFSFCPPDSAIGHCPSENVRQFGLNSGMSARNELRLFDFPEPSESFLTEQEPVFQKPKGETSPKFQLFIG